MMEEKDYLIASVVMALLRMTFFIVVFSIFLSNYAMANDEKWLKVYQNNSETCYINLQSIKLDTSQSNESINYIVCDVKCYSSNSAKEFLIGLFEAAQKTAPEEFRNVNFKMFSYSIDRCIFDISNNRYTREQSILYDNKDRVILTFPKHTLIWNDIAPNTNNAILINKVIEKYNENQKDKNGTDESNN